MKKKENIQEMCFVLAFGQTCPNSESDEGLMHTVTGTVGVPVTASQLLS